MGKQEEEGGEKAWVERVHIEPGKSDRLVHDGHIGER